LIKINLVREGRAVRGAGAAPAAAAVSAVGGAGANINNILIVACLIAGTLAALAYWYFNRRELKSLEEVARQRASEAQKLESIIKEVDDYTKRKDSLQQRIDLINKLKQNQKGPVRVMDQLSRDLPDLVWLDTMEMTEGRIALAGRGLNLNAIALFIENIKNDPYFEEPQVGAVTQVSATPVVYGFDMNFAFAYTPKTATPPGATDTSATDTSATDTAATQ
jgi:Tfp pilus assembly protein PilN